MTQSKNLATARDADVGEPLLGSYFVSAYPPFAFWSEEGAARFARQLEQALAERPRLGLYVHVPFCSQRCHFCYYLSHDDREGDLDPYLDALAEELELYSGKPYLAGRELDFVYFGGGTPSLLSSRRIERLLGRLQEAFPWRAAREVTFECAPRSVTERKLEALRRLGVTRISLGVQELDDRVLAASGRIHLVADVERAVAAIREVGFPVLNVDLIVGLADQTDDTFTASLERVVAMAPESVTLYLLEIPHNTPLFRAIVAGAQSPPPGGWTAKRARLARGFARLEEAGYTVASAYTVVRDPARHRFLYQEEQYRGADLLGIGASAFSYLGGVHQQNVASLEGYLARRGTGELPLWRGYALDREERFVRELVLQLKLGWVDVERLRQRHRSDPLRRFAGPLAEHTERGWLTVGGGAIRLERAGLARVDRLLASYYLPRHRVAPPAPAAGG